MKSFRDSDLIEVSAIDLVKIKFIPMMICELNKSEIFNLRLEKVLIVLSITHHFYIKKHVFFVFPELQPFFFLTS